MGKDFRETKNPDGRQQSPPHAQPPHHNGMPGTVRTEERQMIKNREKRETKKVSTTTLKCNSFRESKFVLKTQKMCRLATHFSSSLHLGQNQLSKLQISPETWEGGFTMSPNYSLSINFLFFFYTTRHSGIFLPVFDK